MKLEIVSFVVCLLFGFGFCSHQTCPMRSIIGCDKGFTYFQRNPTEKNNFTSEWCLGVFPQKHVTECEGREICQNLGATISMFENEEEFKEIDVNKYIYVFIDGYRMQRCHDRSSYREWKCQPLRSFQFRSSATDPTFTLSNWRADDPNYFEGKPEDEQHCISFSADGTIDVGCKGHEQINHVLCGKPPSHQYY
ncbi:unnamed protein product [Caenorhabditis angaria]|uniref:C-type lectin domain-containing protein n=1 Tax=Caenorhabditis angaria TaxID=860376 RepID=A0A9P1IEL4_9PELO|nr:unnamed protein product [Caenorhabditis angaria]